MLPGSSPGHPMVLWDEIGCDVIGYDRTGCSAVTVSRPSPTLNVDVQLIY